MVHFWLQRWKVSLPGCSRSEAEYFPLPPEAPSFFLPTTTTKQHLATQHQAVNKCVAVCVCACSSPFFRPFSKLFSSGTTQQEEGCGRWGHLVLQAALLVSTAGGCDSLGLLMTITYYSKKELELNSPTVRDGQPAAKESQFRRTYVRYIQRVGKDLKL